MAASMYTCRALLKVNCARKTLLHARSYTIRPPEWMGNSAFLRKDGALMEEQSFAQKMREEMAVDPEVAKPVNIGIDLKPPGIKRKTKMDQFRKNRLNKELERAARHQTLEIPLETVKQDWLEEMGPHHLHAVAEHYGIYRDLFDGAYFLPALTVDIHYDYDEEYVTPVHQGNQISPEEAVSAPHVSYDAEPDSFWTLIMTNPDGHLTENNKEYLHWMVANIQGSDLSSGEVLCDYLRPFPARGTGFHRHIFVLFKQSGKLDLSEYQRATPCSSLAERTFETVEFYRKHQENLTPVGLNFFQSDWDHSVREIYHQFLNMREPEFEFMHPPPYHPPQKMYPRHEPFDRYYDRYRDKKDIREEVLKMKLKMISPYKDYEAPSKYPLIHHKLNHIEYKPMWLRRREELKHRRIEQFKDLP